MLIAFPLLFVRKKILAFPYLLLINLYFLSIVWYYRVYSTIMPLSSYLMVYNLDGLSLAFFDLLGLGYICSFSFCFLGYILLFCI